MHCSNAYEITSKQVLVPKRGKKKHQHFLCPVNHLNQRQSPSATLVSKEIETTFRSSFFPKSRKVPEVADVPIVRGGWGGGRVSSVVREESVFSELMRSRRFAGARGGAC